MGFDAEIDMDCAGVLQQPRVVFPLSLWDQDVVWDSCFLADTSLVVVRFEFDVRGQRTGVESACLQAVAPLVHVFRVIMDV